MSSPAMSRLGYCARGSNDVQQVDPAFLFENGDASRAIRRIEHDAPRIDVWLALNTSVGAINTCVYQSIYREHFHAPLLNAATNVIDISNRYMGSSTHKRGMERILLLGK